MKMKNIYWPNVRFWAILIISTLCIMFCVYVILSGIEEIYDIGLEYKSNIGKYVVIENDTLLVVDASMIKSSYTLSNGLEIDNTLFDKYVINTKQD